VDRKPARALRDSGFLPQRQVRSVVSKRLQLPEIKMLGLRLRMPTWRDCSESFLTIQQADLPTAMLLRA
jgi:hypothetical protein